MKKEISAGGLIVRKTPKGWEVLRVRDMNGVWTFPKGKIEEDESLQETAVREIAEEVGLHGLVYLGKLTPIHYVYTRNGQVDKTVHYFVFQYEGGLIPIGQTEEGIHDPTWVPFDQAATDIGYPDSAIPLIEEAKGILTAL